MDRKVSAQLKRQYRTISRMRSIYRKLLREHGNLSRFLAHTPDWPQRLVSRLIDLEIQIDRLQERYRDYTGGLELDSDSDD